MNWLEKILKDLPKVNGKEVTAYRFGKMCDLPKSTITRIINNDRGIETIMLSTADSIAKGLDIDVAEFIVKYYKVGK